MTTVGGGHPIDVTLNVERDAGGRDPDRFSPTLRRYHQLLWSKPLPNGPEFSLDTTTPQAYLHHASAVGEFFMASDSIVHSYRGAYMNRIGGVMDQVPPGHVAELHDEGSTIGGYLLFPGDRRDRKPTINGARGMNAKICDRIDLTLECIRRHYAREDSPAAGALNRYQDFFGCSATSATTSSSSSSTTSWTPTAARSAGTCPSTTSTARRCRGPLMTTKPTARPPCDSSAPATSESSSGRLRISPDRTSEARPSAA